MQDNELGDILTFLRASEQLKNTLRSANTSDGRHESTAEHTWRLCLMLMLFERHYPDLDMLKVIKIGIIHDLGEAISGDIPAVEQIEGMDKGAEERIDLLLLLSALPDYLRTDILALWDDYENASSQEAQLVKAFDKLETILQHTQGQNPEGFDYGFNLSYGKTYTDYDAVTSALRGMIDKDTERLANGSGTK